MGKAAAGAVKAGAAYVEIGADDAKLARALKGAKASLSRFAADIGKFGRNLGIAGVAMLAPIAIAIKKAGEFQGIMSKFRVVFGDFSDETIRWSNNLADTIGRARVDLLNYLATFQDTFVPLGFARDKAKELSKQLTSLGLDLASSNEATTTEAEAMRALQSALVGNHEAVRGFGIMITEATLKQELMSMGVKKGTKEATQQQKVLARLSLITRMSADAIGDAERTAGDYVNQTKRLRANLSNLAVTVGTELLPRMITFVGLANKFAKATSIWVRANKEIIVTYVKLAFTLIAVGATLWTLGKIIGLVMFMFTPAGALGLAIAGVLALLDALGVVNIGFVDFLQNIRLGGLKISTWIQTAWIEIFKGWERVKSALMTSWDGLVMGTRVLGNALFSALIWVPEKILEGFDWMIREVVSKLNWLVEQANKLPYVDIKKIMAPTIAKDAAEFLKNLSKGSAEASGEEWAKFEKKRQKRAKETQAIISALSAVQQKIILKDIAGIKKVAITTEAAAAPAAPAMPAMPTVPTTTAGPTTDIVGTFAGRRAGQMAGAGTLERESLNVEKLMARLLGVIAENTKEGGMSLG